MTANLGLHSDQIVTQIYTLLHLNVFLWYIVQLSDQHGTTDGSDYLELQRNLGKFRILFPLERQTFPVNVKSWMLSLYCGVQRGSRTQTTAIRCWKKTFHYFIWEEEENKWGEISSVFCVLATPFIQNFTADSSPPMQQDCQKHCKLQS